MTDPLRSRRAAGAKAKGNGQLFELLLQVNCRRAGVACTRIPDGCESTGGRGIRRVKTPWDFILSKNGRAALIDTKTTAGKTFALSKIEAHQVDAMMLHAGQPSGLVAGYVIWFRSSLTVGFVPAQVLSALMRERAQGSIAANSACVWQMGSDQRIDFTPLFR